jgi:hypothetical protein
LDEWLEKDRIQIDDDTMTLEDGKRFRLVPAVYFMQVVGDDADAHDLLEKVKTKPQLDEISAEHYRDSVIVGEVGYQVLEGFVGETLGT